MVRYWDFFFLLGYLIFLSVSVFPRLRWDYDIGHHAILLMTSIRIWAGQVPYRDFYPWYGPLFHYLLALPVGAAGNNLYAIKLFINLISPALSLAILILVLRMMKIAGRSRAFILAATIAFGLERLIGSLRAFLPVLIIAWWIRGHKRKPGWAGLLIFPGVLLAFFFSPETGIYLLPAALLFILLELFLLKSGKDRLRFSLWFSSGALAGAIFLLILFIRTVWFRNYLIFISSLMKNFRWIAGLSIPGLEAILGYPLLALYYLPLLIYGLAIVLVLRSLLRPGFNPDLCLLTAVLAVFGAMIWHTATERTSPSHLQYALLPSIIIAGLAWPRNLKPVRAWKLSAAAALLSFLIAGSIFFKPAPFPAFKGKDYGELMGVRVVAWNRALFDQIQEFVDTHQKDQIIFPFKSFYYGFLGMEPKLPLDGLEILVYPVDSAHYLHSVKNLDGRYVIINQDDLFWSITGGVVDILMDYIDQNYQPIVINGPLRIYQKRNRPAILSALAAQDPETHLLTPENNFQIDLPVPDQVNQNSGYLELEAEFEYGSGLARSFSLPIVMCKFDGRTWLFYRPEIGRQRINNTPGPHPFRVYLLYPAKYLTFQVDFPGAFNFTPAKIILKNVRWHIPRETVTPRSVLYLLQSNPASVPAPGAAE